MERREKQMRSVEFQGISKVFNGVLALNDLNAEIKAGEFVVFVGPSGSGKTTALRILAGLEVPSSGNIRIGDEDVTNQSPAKRDLAMVFQSYALYPHMTVHNNLAYGLHRRRIAASIIAERIQEVTQLLDINDLLERYPDQLSGGQRQRVAVARALARHPGVLLMDEPLSNLDAKLRSHARSEIRRIQATAGSTTAYVTHDQVEAMTMGDRVAVMNRGELVQFDTPQAIYSAPISTFVAGFMGSPGMNLFPAGVIQTSAGIELTLFGTALKVSITNMPWRTQPTTVGVRPEDTHLEADTENDKWIGSIPGTITYLENLGRERFANVELPGGINIVSLCSKRGIECVGDQVRVSFNQRQLHLFDQSGLAVAHLNAFNDGLEK